MTVQLPSDLRWIASVYVGEEELPEGSTAMRLDLAGFSRLLDRLGR